MGRYPFIGGSISLMFYYLLSHLFRSLINFVVLVVGFAFGFFIISQDKGRSDTSSNPVLHEKSNCQIDHLFVMAAPAANAEPFDRINDSILETSQQQKVFFYLAPWCEFLQFAPKCFRLFY